VDVDVADSLRVSRSRSRPPIRRNRLNALRLISVSTGVLLALLAFAAIGGDQDVVRIVGPLYALLFVMLLAGVAVAARRGWWSWRFVAAVAVLGPIASIPGLEIQRAGAARRERFSAER
jgi:hypothetical protein